MGVLSAWCLVSFLALVLGVGLACAEVEGIWTLLAPPTSSSARTLPSARCNHCSVFVPSLSVLYVFGGNEGVWEFLPLNDLWAWDLAAHSWSLVIPKNAEASLPTKRFRHSCVYDEKTHSIFVFGGMTQNEDPTMPNIVLGDLWKYDIDAETWTELHATNADASPPARFYHVAGLQPRQGDGNLMVVFGGIDNSLRYNDMWKYDIEKSKWSATKYAGESFGPPPLSNPAARVSNDGEYLHIFGGQRWWGYQGIINSVYRCHLPSNTWEEVTTQGTPPEPKIGASAVLLQESSSLFIFGGYNVDGYYVNDLHTLDLSTGDWRKVASKDEVRPDKRYAHSAVQTAEDSMVVFGGYSDYLSNAGNFHDLWRFDAIPEKEASWLVA